MFTKKLMDDDFKWTSLILKKLVLVLSMTYLPDDLLNKWDKVFKNGPSKICGRQVLKDLKET